MNDGHGSRLNILAIDDAADVLGKISAIAADAGYACRCVRDAQSARESVRQSAPDLIISAISLAGRSGVAICDELKLQIGHADLPVMFLSAAQGPDIIRRANPSGGTYYLRKPFDAGVLVQLIEKSRHVLHLAHH
jgi:CheY-like chemotaxis protein